MPQRSDWLPVFGGGIIVGVVVLGLTMTAVDSSLTVSEFVKEYQTLLVGTVAVAVALLSAYFLYRQITSDARIRADSARASLPAYLSDVSHYAEQSIILTHEVYRWLQSGDITAMAPSFELPELGQDTLKSLATAAAVIDPSTGKKIIELIHWYQIQNARLRDMVKEVNSHEHLLTSSFVNSRYAKDRRKDAAILSIKAGQIYRPVRGEVNYERGIDEADIDQRIQFVTKEFS